VLHHVGDVEAAIKNLAASVRPGGALLLIEPDFIPVSVAEPPEVRAFWDGWLAWSRDRGIDYYIGRELARRLAALGLRQISGNAETAIYNGGSPWADYWTQTITELRDDLISSGKLNDALVDTFFIIAPTRAGGLRLLPLLQCTAGHPTVEQTPTHKPGGCDFASIE
jgi:hypothetical protein